MIHAALKQAVRWSLAPRNVAELVDPPRAARTEMRMFSASEARKLQAAVVGDPFEALYLLAITTGMRQGEVLGLRWRDVNLDAKTVQVRVSLQRMPDNQLVLVEPKTASSRRQVLLSTVASDALKRHKARQATDRLRLGSRWSDLDLVFPNEIGKPINPSNLVRSHYLPMLEQAGLPRLRFHDLRHTAATLLLEANVNTKVVSEMLGHSQVSVTMDPYQHVTRTMQQKAADAFDDRLSEPLAVNLAVNPSAGGTAADEEIG
jgi:integrase